MDRHQLIERLRAGEWDEFEVKRAAAGVPDDAYRTVSAFANSAGGWLVFGVEQDGERLIARGVSDPDRLQNDFLTTCRSPEKLTGSVEILPKQLVVDGVTVVGFYVEPASRFERPVRVRVKKAWQSYIRLAAGDHQCTPEEEARFLRDASYEPFDSSECPDSSLGDVDDGSVKWFRGLLAQRDPERAFPDLSSEAFLAEHGLLRASGRLTHAAALFFGQNRLLARLKPGGLVDFRLIHEPWSEQAPEQRWDDRELCEGNLVSSLRTLVERISRLSPQPFEMEENGMRRQAVSTDFTALREALINVLVHQDYSDRLRTATILWYSDRVELSNPGDSFVDLGSMLDGGASQLRNPLITRLFRQAGFAEQAGSGVPAIVRTWRRAERFPPTILNDVARKTYQLTLEWRTLVLPRDLRWFKAIDAPEDQDAARVLSYLREVRRIDRRAARLVTGLPGRELTLLLSELAARRIIEPVDDRADSRFRLTPQAERALPDPGELGDSE